MIYNYIGINNKEHIELAFKYQILTNNTSLFCIVQDNNLTEQEM